MMSIFLILVQKRFRLGSIPQKYPIEFLAFPRTLYYASYVMFPMSTLDPGRD